MAKNNRTIDRIQAVWNKLGGEEGVDRLLRGEVAISVVEHTIDCDADPFLPDGWKVEQHKRGGKFTFDPSHIEFYLDDGQKGGKYIEGNKLRKRLADKLVLNANVLDYLFENPDLIPDEWKTDDAGKNRYIFFWGTVYRDSSGYLYVRCLVWDVGRWRWSSRWLDYDWYGNHPSALRAS